MANLYITSAETFSGKSAICIGLGVQFCGDKLRAGYMKPVNVACRLREGLPYDEDVAFAKEVFRMPDPPTVLGPVALTPAKLEQQVRGPAVDYESKLLEAFNKVSADYDVMVLEGGRSWREGYVANLSPRRVVELVNARVLIVLKYDEILLADRALAAQDYFGDALMGVLINETAHTQIEHAREVMTPYLVRHGLHVFGILPKDQLLASPTVAELADGLHAEILCAADHTGELVEHMLVGAMSAEAALSYFRRQSNKAVITGGDRSDILLAALESSTRCLILTGNLYPNPKVLDRADELGVPVLLSNLDTLSTIEIVEHYLGRSRFQEPRKVERFTAMMSEHFDFATLYARLGIQAK